MSRLTQLGVTITVFVMSMFVGLPAVATTEEGGSNIGIFMPAHIVGVDCPDIEAIRQNLGLDQEIDISCSVSGKNGAMGIFAKLPEGEYALDYAQALSNLPKALFNYDIDVIEPAVCLNEGDVIVFAGDTLSEDWEFRSVFYRTCAKATEIDEETGTPMIITLLIGLSPLIMLAFLLSIAYIDSK